MGKRKEKNMEKGIERVRIALERIHPARLILFLGAFFTALLLTYALRELLLEKSVGSYCLLVKRTSAILEHAAACLLLSAAFGALTDLLYTKEKRK